MENKTYQAPAELSTECNNEYSTLEKYIICGLTACILEHWK